ncbi:MAG: protease modulator HflC [Thermotogaceae bacterium]|nr:protease modulator HflC [Thermotogaceae bacterium]
MGVFIAVAVLILLFTSMFVLDQTQQAVVLRFGKIVWVVKEPGLHFKQPFVDNVVKFEKRMLIYDIEPEKIITADKKTLIIDTYTLWKIKDPRKFMESFKSVRLALPRIDDIVYSHIRDVFAKGTFEEIVSEKREEFLDKVTKLCKRDLDEFGVEVVDVRVKHADLPPENTQAVYNRMKEERYSIAAQIRAEGQKEAQKIRAEADKKVKVILAQAYSEAEKIKGTGDASAVSIYAQSFSKDPDFYEFWRTMELYRDSLKDAVIIAGEDAEILKFMIKEK